MSTDIFQPSDGPAPPSPDPESHLSPLHFYLAASIPLTFVTILIWAALHWLEKSRESFKAQTQRLSKQANRLESLLPL